MRPDERLEKEVAALGDLSREELIGFWEKIYGCVPPKGVRRELLIRAAAWHLQARQLGGLRAETRRLLKAAVEEANRKLALKRIPPEEVCSSAASRSLRRDRLRLAPGARLIRDWNSRSHVVDVIEGGFVFEAKVYPSLTAIARKITGTQWFGLRFFGL